MNRHGDMKKSRHSHAGFRFAVILKRAYLNFHART